MIARGNRVILQTHLHLYYDFFFQIMLVLKGDYS